MKAASVILPGVNDFALDELERFLHDVLCVVKRTLKSSAVVPGGGCVEAAVSIFWDKLLLLCEIDRDLPDGNDFTMRMNPPIKPKHRHVKMRIFRAQCVHSAPGRGDGLEVIQLSGKQLVSLHALSLTL